MRMRFVAAALMLSAGTCAQSASKPPESTDPDLARLQRAFEIVREDALEPVPDAKIAASAERAVATRIGLNSENASDISDEAGLLSRFTEVRDRYRDRVTSFALTAAAVDGMVKATGRPGGFVDMKAARAQVGTVGIGLSVRLDKAQVVVVDVSPDAPATGHIFVGDLIVAIDGVSLAALSIDEVVAKLRGQPGTEIVVTFIHGNAPPTSSSFVRRRLVKSSPQVEAYLEGKIAIVSLPAFYASAPQDLANAIKSTMAAPSGVRALVVDIRGNQGGLFDSVIGCADQFVNKGILSIQHGRTQRDVETYYAKRGDAAAGLPVVLLVDEKTAAGAEMFAAALQTAHRATILGMPTMGMGTIQTLLPLDDDSAIKLTTSQYFRPDGTPLEGHPIVPDVEVESGPAVLSRAIALISEAS